MSCGGTFGTTIAALVPHNNSTVLTLTPFSCLLCSYIEDKVILVADIGISATSLSYYMTPTRQGKYAPCGFPLLPSV